MRGKWEQSWGGKGNDSRCGGENRPLIVFLQATTFRVEGGSNIFKSETIKCFIIFYFHWIQHIHKLDEEIFYHLSKLWALSGVMTFFTSNFVCLKSPNCSTGDDRPIPDPPPHRPTCLSHLPQLRHLLCHKVDIWTIITIIIIIIWYTSITSSSVP